jgi:predicted TIM-barrel fold metal-dependent hydrolase
LYSSDYPHWDFDPPSIGIPRALPRETKAQLLAGNASDLYGIAVR